jgi:hypothetical protein
MTPRRVVRVNSENGVRFRIAACRKRLRNIRTTPRAIPIQQQGQLFLALNMPARVVTPPVNAVSGGEINSQTDVGSSPSSPAQERVGLT